MVVEATILYVKVSKEDFEALKKSANIQIPDALKEFFPGQKELTLGYSKEENALNVTLPIRGATGFGVKLVLKGLEKSGKVKEWKRDVKIRGKSYALRFEKLNTKSADMTLKIMPE